MVDTPPLDRLQPIEVHPYPQLLLLLEPNLEFLSFCLAKRDLASPEVFEFFATLALPVFQSHHRLHNLLPRTEEYSTLSQFVLSGRFDLPAPDPFPPFPPCTQRTPLSEKFFFLRPRQSPHSSGTIFSAPK